MEEGLLAAADNDGHEARQSVGDAHEMSKLAIRRDGLGSGGRTSYEKFAIGSEESLVSEEDERALEQGTSSLLNRMPMS